MLNSIKPIDQIVNENFPNMRLKIIISALSSITSDDLKAACYDPEWRDLLATIINQAESIRDEGDYMGNRLNSIN